MQVVVNVRLLQAEEAEKYTSRIEDILISSLPTTGIRNRSSAIISAFADPNSYIFGAFLGTDLVGVAVGAVVTAFTRRVYYVNDVARRSDMRDKGIGRALMRAMEEHAVVDHACCRIELTARREPAQEFYQRLGYYRRDTQVFCKDL